MESDIENSKKVIFEDIQKEFNMDFNIWGASVQQDTLIVSFHKGYHLYKSNKIQKTFELILKDFYPRYFNILLKHKHLIKELQIVGHLASNNVRGKTKKDRYMRNMILSKESAEGIFEYIERLPDDVIVNHKNWLQKNTQTIGKSSSELILTRNDKEDERRSRRIEFKIVFKKFQKVKAIAPVEIKEKIVEQISNHLEPLVISKPKQKIILLSNYVKRLLLENPTINEQLQLMNSIRQDIYIANAAFKPLLELNYSHTYFKESTSDDKNKAVDKDITFRYNLFNGYKDEKEIKIREYTYNTSLYAKQQIELDLIYSISEAFVNIQKQYEIIKLSKINIDDYEQWIKKENLKYDIGLTTLKDFAKIKSRYITKKMNFEELQRVYNDNHATFQKYIDFDIKDVKFFEKLNPTSVYFDNKKLSIEDAEYFSPYILEAKENVLLYNEKVDKSIVTFYPTIDLIGKKRFLDERFDKSDDTSSSEMSIMLEAKLNLYDGNKDKYEYDKKLFDYRQKILKQEEVFRDTKYKINLAFNKYNLTKIKEEYLNDLINQREESYIGANYDYKFGKIDANGLLDVVDDVYGAQKLYLENKYEYILSKYKLFTDIGIIRKKILDE